jgi:tryptophanyl-tRNA synthetase
MSKSYDNHIPMFEESARLKKLVAKIKTDSLPPEAPKSTEGSLIFDLYRAFASPQEVEEMRARYAKGIGWGAAKEELHRVMDIYLSGPREKYKALMSDTSQIDEMLAKGAEIARAKSAPFLKEIRRAIGIGI